MEDLKTLHDQALQAAGQAKKAVEQNAMMLQQKIAERTKLLSQLEQAKMQEQVSASLQSMSEMSAPGNTPSLDEVRDKIERRYANAMGCGRAGPELGAGPDDGGSAGQRADGRAFAARADPRLDARRRAAGRWRHHPPRRRPTRPPRRRKTRSHNSFEVSTWQRIKDRTPEGLAHVGQRGVDTAAEFADVLAQKLGAAADPRAKLLRKRRWALRAGCSSRSPPVSGSR